MAAKAPLTQSNFYSITLSGDADQYKIIGQVEVPGKGPLTLKSLIATLDLTGITGLGIYVFGEDIGAGLGNNIVADTLNLGSYSSSLLGWIALQGSDDPASEAASSIFTISLASSLEFPPQSEALYFVIVNTGSTTIGSGRTLSLSLRFDNS